MEVIQGKSDAATPWYEAWAGDERALRRPPSPLTRFTSKLTTHPVRSSSFTPNTTSTKSTTRSSKGKTRPAGCTTTRRTSPEGQWRPQLSPSETLNAAPARPHEADPLALVCRLLRITGEYLTAAAMGAMPEQVTSQAQPGKSLMPRLGHRPASQPRASRLTTPPLTPVQSSTRTCLRPSSSASARPAGQSSCPSKPGLPRTLQIDSWLMLVWMRLPRPAAGRCLTSSRVSRACFGTRPCARSSQVAMSSAYECERTESCCIPTLAMHWVKLLGPKPVAMYAPQIGLGAATPSGARTRPAPLVAPAPPPLQSRRIPVKLVALVSPHPSRTLVRSPTAFQPPPHRHLPETAAQPCHLPRLPIHVEPEWLIHLAPIRRCVQKALPTLAVRLAQAVPDEGCREPPPCLCLRSCDFHVQVCAHVHVQTGRSPLQRRGSVVHKHNISINIIRA